MSKNTQKLSSGSVTPEGRNAFKLSLVSDNLTGLMGEILTIIDASTEGDKNKALKDLIKQRFYDKMGWFCELAWKELEVEGSGHQPAQPWEHLIIPAGDKLYSYKH